MRRALAGDPGAPILVFDDGTGAVVDIDMRGDTAVPAARPAKPSGRPKPRGRPKLGVVAREVTLLPRHWDWLSKQHGGASAALRRLVDEARRADGDRTATRARQEAAYRFLSALAGDLPGFEEASRALFAGDRARFGQCAASWPKDVRAYADALAWRQGAPRKEDR